MIDYVLRVTGQEKLYYIGHSQGTTSFFVMTSERPEYNDKIRLGVMLAPIGYMSNMRNPFFQLLAIFEGVIDVSDKSCNEALKNCNSCLEKNLYFVISYKI